MAVAFFAISSNYCCDVQIVGDFPEQEVTAALAQLNVGKGTNLSRLDVDCLENDLANALDAMYAVVKRSGSLLQINAVKKRPPVPTVDLHTQRDVVATADGTITYIFCEQGTPVVKVGDVVKKGDVLIRGLRVFNDGTTQGVWALGKIKLQQQCSAFAPFEGSKTVTVQTGNVFEVNAVVLLGKAYGRNCPFESFDEQTKETYLFPLNLCIRHRVCAETCTRVVAATLAECEQQLKDQALAQATALANFEVVSYRFAVTEQGVTATVFGETEI